MPNNDDIELCSTPEGDARKTVELLREISIQISKDPSARERMIRTITGDSKQAVLRATVGLRGNSLPYYKEHYARELIPYLDMMIEQNKAIEFKYVNYKHLGKQTLRLKVYQALLFVVDNLDPEGKYLELKNKTMVRAMTNGVRISFIDNLKIPLAGALVENDDEAGSSNTPFWRNKIDEFLANASVGKRLSISSLRLTDQEVSDLQASFAGLNGVIANVTNRRIDLFKIDPDKLTEAEAQ